MNAKYPYSAALANAEVKWVESFIFDWKVEVSKKDMKLGDHIVVTVTSLDSSSLHLLSQSESHSTSYFIFSILWPIDTLTAFWTDFCSLQELKVCRELKGGDSHEKVLLHSPSLFPPPSCRFSSNASVDRRPRNQPLAVHTVYNNSRIS